VQAISEPFGRNYPVKLNVNFSIGNVCFAPMRFPEQSLNDYFIIIADDMAYQNEING